MSEPTLKLQAGAEELLSAFPAGEPDFEAQAKAIEARVLGAATDAHAAELLKAPELAAEPGEPPLPSSVRSAEAPKSNFAEMARRSLQKKEDDGVALAKELLAATAQSRRPSAEMVERVRAAGRAATATPTPTRGAEDSERSSGVIARAEPAAQVQAQAPAPAAKSRGMLVGIATGALALAACLALYVKTGQPESSTSAALAAEKAAAVPREPHAVTATPGAAALAGDAKTDGVVSPESMAQQAATPAPEHAPAARTVASKAGAAVGAAVAAGAASVAPATPQAVVLEEEPEQVKGASPSEPQPQAEPPAEALKPAEGTSGGVPLTPSAGAVSTALGSVRSSAQACLAGQTDPVSAVVTFAADGHVLRVTAGGPSGPCIQAALSKAHIQPFARESYAAPITVRPR